VPTPPLIAGRSKTRRRILREFITVFSNDPMLSMPSNYILWRFATDRTTSSRTSTSPWLRCARRRTGCTLTSMSSRSARHILRLKYIRVFVHHRKMRDGTSMVSWGTRSRLLRPRIRGSSSCRTTLDLIDEWFVKAGDGAGIVVLPRRRRVSGFRPFRTGMRMLHSGTKRRRDGEARCCARPRPNETGRGSELTRRRGRRNR
jgi:hypothetical protein